MRTAEEQKEFVGTICMAARRIGVYARWEGEDFKWFDPMSSAQWLVPAKENKKDTMEAACETLINHLQWKTQTS